MNRVLLIAGAALLFVGCSSSPKEEQPEVVSESGPAPWDTAAPDAGSESTVTAKKEASRPVYSSSKQDAGSGKEHSSELSAAIRSQSDEQIRGAAQEVLRRSPNDERAINALAMYHYRKGKFDLAAYFLNKGIQKNPNKGELHSNLGLVELARNQRAAAVKSFRRAIELNPDDGAAAGNLGAIYAGEKDYTKAVTILEINYRRGPKNPQTLNNYGVALMATGKYDRSRKVLEEGLNAASNNRELLLNYAILLVEHLGDSKEGLDVINRLRFLGPSSESRERLSLLENKAKAGVK